MSKIHSNMLSAATRRRSILSMHFLAVVFLAACANSGASDDQQSQEGIGANQLQASISYQLAPEDVLDIFVWEEEELTRQVVVRPDGAISFPLAGEVVAQGRTVKELEAEITNKLQKYIPEAVVSVTVAKVAGYRVYVVGKVNNPGEFVLGSYVNVMQAITLADGVTPYAKKQDIKVVRRDGSSERVFKFNYADVERGRNLSQNITLKAGDTVIVP